MILISHRGNINGRILEAENKPDYIDDTIRLGYDVEIDLWYDNSTYYLGHDLPQYEVSLEWLIERQDKLWVHCKNIGALLEMKKHTFHYFWHEEDFVTLTSQNYIWAYPGNQPLVESIAVLPELKDEDVSKCVGVCSDYIQNYKA